MPPPIVRWIVLAPPAARDPARLAAQVRGLLDVNGLRRTVARTQVLTVLLMREERDEPFTAAWLSAQLEELGRSVHVASLYSVLEAFRRAGMIATVGTGAAGRGP
jgi:Fe2+ or Zn2+ uptake regulation protein